MLLLIDRSEGQNNIGLTIGEWIVQVRQLEPQSLWRS